MIEASILDEIFPPEIFSTLERERIIPAYQKKLFKKNEFILREKETAFSYYFVEEGYYRSFAIDQAGIDISTGFFTRGEVMIDWPSFLLQAPSRENIQALSDGICWKLDFQSFQIFFHEIEAFRENGRTRLVRNYFDLKRRSVSSITDTAKERYIQLLNEKPNLLNNISLKHIATFLGITDTSLSRIRKEIATQ